jgi:hypothetical protein
MRAPAQLALQAVLPIGSLFLIVYWSWRLQMDPVVAESNSLLPVTIIAIVGLHLVCGLSVGWIHHRERGSALLESWRCVIWTWAWLQVFCVLALGILWLWVLVVGWIIHLFLFLFTLLGAAIGEAWAAYLYPTEYPTTRPSTDAKLREFGENLVNLTKFLYYLWKRPK